MMTNNDRVTKKGVDQKLNLLQGHNQIHFEPEGIPIVHASSQMCATLGFVPKLPAARGPPKKAQ